LSRIKEEEGLVGATTEKEGRRGERRPTGDEVRDKGWTLLLVVVAAGKATSAGAAASFFTSFSLSRSTNAWMSPLAPIEEKSEARWLLPNAPPLLPPLPSQRDPALQDES
jgi:hypothetical protein